LLRAIHSDRNSEVQSKTLRILDGGVVDTTGLDTVHHLILSLQRVAESSAPSRARAGQVLNVLRRRGVIVIEIDSGAKPLKRETGGVLAAVKEPLSALNNALYGNADRSKRYFQERLQVL